jgi:hypothetical protein
MPICEFLSHASFSRFTLQLHRNGQSKKTLQEFVSRYKDKWPNAAHGKLTNKTNMKTLRAVLLDREHGFTIRVPLPDASNTDTRVEGNIPGAGNMGDFPSTPPSSTVVFDSVKAPGEFEIRFPCILSHFYTRPL